MAILFLMNITAVTKVEAAKEFGSVDLSRLFDGYSKTQDYDGAFAEKQKAFEKEKDSRIAELKQLQDSLSLLNEKEKENQKSKIDQKTQILQDFDRQKQADLRKERDEKIKEILKDIEKAIREYAQKEGYTFIFNDRVLLYSAKEADLTDKILEILNKKSTGR